MKAARAAGAVASGGVGGGERERRELSAMDSDTSVLVNGVLLGQIMTRLSSKTSAKILSRVLEAISAQNGR